MRVVRLIAAILILAGALPVLAQTDEQNTLTFNDFNITFLSALASHANIVQYPGDPPELQQPGGPEPFHTRISLFADVPTPEALFNSVVTARVYNIDQLANYQFYAEQVTLLQALLVERPDLASFMTADPSNPNPQTSWLPFLPVFPAAQVIRARAQYVSTPFFNGIAYITAYAQDVSPFVSTSFLYTFQGVSVDGTRYVSIVAPVANALFPNEYPSLDYDAFAADYQNYLIQSIGQLNAAQPTDFTPALPLLDALVNSLAVSS